MIPSGRRLSSADAIRLAKAALEECDRFWNGNEKIADELYDLDLLTASHLYMAVDVALQEIAPCWRLGPQPPNDVSHAGDYLYAFYWDSTEWKKFMYFKFAISDDAGRKHLVLHSFHESTDKDQDEMF
jgi:hypothetical protein